MSVEFCVSLSMLNILTYYFITCKYLKYATNFELYSDVICFQIYWEPQQIKAARTSLDLTRRHPLGIWEKRSLKTACVSLLFSPVPEERIGIWNRLMKDLGHGTGFQREQSGRGHPAHPRAGPLFCGLQKFPLLLLSILSSL